MMALRARSLFASAPSIALLAAWLVSPSVLAAAPAEDAEAEHPVDPTLFQGLEWRNVGPSRGGRVTAVAGVPGAPFTYYFGATGGGVWKTTDGGTTWHNVSDEFFGSGSVGALAVAPGDPNVVYAGMGESPIRGVATGHGDGVYRSTDAGRTWTHLGLDGTEHVGGLAVHPRDPDVVWVAAQGSAWRPTAERGVYRSRNGGATWEQVLFVSEAAGASGLALDPTNPRILYAAFWDHDRDPWRIRSGGPGSGVWKTTDGGDTWKRLGHREEDRDEEVGDDARLPELMGKVRVAVSPARPERVWAMVEAEGDDGGLYRSDDAGKSWRRVNGERVLRARAWYYTHVFADPVDADTVYVLNAPFMKSTDGGRSFSRVRTPHGDNHALWIAPEDNRRMINGNDGGANVSFNGGETWSTQGNQPTAQFYRVDVDSVFPYRLYGGQQDNSTVAIASAGRGGIGRADWYDVGGCESAHVAFDPQDPARIYAGCYQGIISEWDAVTRSERTIMAVPFLGLGTHPKDQPYRFNWNAPIEVSPHDPSVIYHAGNMLLRSADRGRTWTEVSPDLTRDEEERQGAGGAPITDELAGGETYNTIFYVALSPHEEGTIWAGSDDGLVHVTRDGGASWSEVSPPGIGTAAELGQVNAIEVSPHDPAAAYVAVTRYKFGDYRPYAFKTTDYGASWTAIGGGIPEGSWVRVVREDPIRRGLLYAGTETGAFVSFDDGARWQPLELGLPVVPVTDLKVQDGDLVAATQGRAFWILDELGPLRQVGGAVEEEVAAAGVHLYEPSPAVRVQWGGGFGGGGGEGVGKNPPGGAVIDYVLSEDLAEELADGGGEGKGDRGSDGRRLGSDGHPEGSAGVASSPAGKRLRGTTPGAATQLRSSASGADVSGADGEGEAGGGTPQGEEDGDHQHLKRPTSASAGAGGGTEEEEKVAELRLEILDSEGRVVRKYSSRAEKGAGGPGGGEGGPFGGGGAATLPVKAGMNRFVWDLREKGALQVPGLFTFGGDDGPLVTPGSYRVRLATGDREATGELELVEDPRIETGGEGYREQQALLAGIRTAIDELNDSVLRARAVKEQVEEEVKRAGDLEGNDEGAEAIEKAGKDLAKALTEWEETVVQPKSETFQDIINFPNRLDAQVLFLFGAVDESGPPVTEGAKARWASLEGEWRERQAELQKILDEQVAAFNALVAEHQVPAVVIPPAGKHLEENGED